MSIVSLEDSQSVRRTRIASFFEGGQMAPNLRVLGRFNGRRTCCCPPPPPLVNDQISRKFSGDVSSQLPFPAGNRGTYADRDPPFFRIPMSGLLELRGSSAVGSANH